MTQLHRYDPVTDECLACGIAARDVADEKVRKGGERKLLECPGFQASNRAGLVIVTADERLCLMQNGVTVLQLDAGAMFDLRDAIDDGVSYVRRGK